MPGSAILAATILLVAAPASAGGNAAAAAIVRNLDVTSFPSSIGPRRAPGRTTFAAYGFDEVTYWPDGATLTWRGQRWSMSFRIVSDGPRHADICLRDEALPGPGGRFNGTYDAVSALRIDKTGRGRWPATPIPAGLPGCANDPPVEPK